VQLVVPEFLPHRTMDTGSESPVSFTSFTAESGDSLDLIRASISSTMAFRRLNWTRSLEEGLQAGPYRRSSSLTAGLPSIPTIHSSHSFVTVLTARESEYTGVGGVPAWEPPTQSCTTGCVGLRGWGSEA
jgi:hypothetical protein